MTFLIYNWYPPPPDPTQGTDMPSLGTHVNDFLVHPDPGVAILGILMAVFIVFWFFSPMMRTTFRELRKSPLLMAIRTGLMAAYPDRRDFPRTGETVISTHPVKPFIKT